MNQQERCLCLIQALMDEMPQYRDTPIPALPDHMWRLLRSLLNVRLPMPATDKFLQIQDAYLRKMTTEKGIADSSLFPVSAKNTRLIL